MSEKKIDFEESLAELEKILEKFEKGECTLDESIELFEQGMKHIGNCRSALETAQKRIVALSDYETEQSHDD